MTADWVRAKYFDNAEDYANTVAVLLGTHGKLKREWRVDCTLKIKCWTSRSSAYWMKKIINIGMRDIGLKIQMNSFTEWKNTEYLLDGFFPYGLEIPELTIVHEYAHIVAGQMYRKKCNHGPEYQEVYSIMLDSHFDIGAVKRYKERNE